MRVLVTGATGLVGCHATARLVSDGHTVRALVRDAAKLARTLEPLGVPEAAVEAVEGDILEPAAIDSIMEAEGGSKLPYELVEKVDRRPRTDGSRSFVDVQLLEELDLPVPYSILGYNPARGTMARKTGGPG